MYCFALLFTRRGKGCAHDDRIFVSPHEDSRDIFEVKYHNPETKKDKMFLASFSGVLSYIEDTLTSMRLDVDPFEHIQLNSVIHPAVLFHVADMSEYENRDNILNMVRDSMRFSVTSVSE